MKSITRKRKLMLNTSSSLIFQITTIVCGFILPRFILKQYGSDINGLTNSIAQFLSVISFMELGVGSVVKSSLYKPLVNKDETQCSRVIASAGRFFRKLSYIMLVYLVIVVAFYPLIVKQNYGWVFTALLILAMSISSFAQYYFGIVDSLLLIADQKGYIQYRVQTVTLIVNTVCCVFLMQVGASIQMVKLTTSLIFLTRPLFLRWYVNHYYHINRKITYDTEPIQQKWNGVAQHISAVVLDGTDIMVLTVLASLSDVSVYSVYNLVVHGVKQLFLSLTNGIQSLIGELWAKQEMHGLRKTFSWMEWVIHTAAALIFGCTAALVLPFVTVYTAGIYDANYMQPLFAFLIVVAQAGHCLRLPYNIVILAAGHYKQTQRNYIVAAIMNIAISVITVKYWGLIGVAIGTLSATFYQTIWMAIYNSRRLIRGSIKSFVKQMFADVIMIGGIYIATMSLQLHSVSYLSWLILAVEVFLIALVIVLLVNMIFYREKLKMLSRRILK